MLSFAENLYVVMAVYAGAKNACMGVCGALERVRFNTLHLADSRIIIIIIIIVIYDSRPMFVQCIGEMAWTQQTPILV